MHITFIIVCGRVVGQYSVISCLSDYEIKLKYYIHIHLVNS